MIRILSIHRGALVSYYLEPLLTSMEMSEIKAWFEEQGICHPGLSVHPQMLLLTPQEAEEVETAMIMRFG